VKAPVCSETQRIYKYSKHQGTAQIFQYRL
jgi:hypothetical protein